MPNMELNIAGWDMAIVVVYLVGIVALGCWAGTRRPKGQGQDYFLAGRTLSWPIIGLALFSTNISTIHLVSQAEEGYKNGLAYGNFEWMAAFTLIALALFFAPLYIRTRVSTLPDFLETRYNRACRNWLAVLSIISAVLIHIGFSLYTGAIVLKGLFGIDVMTSIVLIAVLTGLYTVIGGLMAVVVTESVQTIILLAGAICITTIGYIKVGGWEGLASSVDPVKLTMLRSAADPAKLPWYAVLLGYPVTGIWYWCADQTIVQRVLAAKNENHARVGPLFAGFIKILPVFIFILPGTIALALIKQGKIPPLENSADTYSHLIQTLLPTGLKGVVAAALLAALMGTVSGALNSIATLFSYDIYKPLRPQTSDRTLVLIGRIVTVIAMVAAILWSPLIGNFESIYQGCVKIVCYISPPITAVFLLGVFWRRASALGAMAALYIGSVMGLVTFLLDWYKVDWWTINPLMATFYLCVICCLIQIVVSLAKPAQLTDRAKELVWSDWREPLRGRAWSGLGNYKFLSALLFVVMIVLYVIFR
ncbi:MAG: sodium:solute symporter [Sedimentisphaerales bacterium]|nr:sodium:solute symporter [Sedimentisphaerales bacterium]